AGMEELGRRFAASEPDSVVVLTPHSVHVEGSMAVVVAGAHAGLLAGSNGAGIELACPSDRQLALELLVRLWSARVPAVGLSYGGNDPAEAVMPMDWGTLIPLWFMGGRCEPPLPAVVVSPARDLPASEHVRAGRSI